MTRKPAFVFGVFFTGILSSLSVHAATAGSKPAAESSQSEVYRLLAQAQAAELDGEAAKRESLLRDVLAIDSNCKLARWQLGQVEIEDKWQPVGDVQRQMAADPRYAKYTELRAEYGQTPAGHLALAQWCKRQGLPQEANFHWAAVLSFEPNHEEALRELGKRWVEGRLLTAEQRVELRRERREAKRSSKKWSAKLAGWERAISSSDPAERLRAQSEIRSIADTHAILALEETTLDTVGNDERKLEPSRTIGLAFVEALDAIEGRTASNSLSRHAVFAPADEVRLAATDALKKRSLFAYVPPLMDALAMPIKSSFSIQVSQGGSVYYHHELFREGILSNAAFDRQMTIRQVDWRVINRGDLRRESDAIIGERKALIAANGKSLFASAAFLAEQQVTQENHATSMLNSRIAAVLERTTGQEFGADPRKWWDWWQAYNEYYVPEERPTYSECYVVIYEHRHRSMSCFAAGTPVWTKTGQRPIESLEIGDLVLSQDVESGELGFQPVIGRTVRPPSSILKLAYDGGSLRTTLGHPFWVNGKSWRMAKQLEEGMILHTIDGPAIIDAVESDGETEAYNLVVANTNNYFVGERGVLVHDNTPQVPSRAKVPGMVVARQ